jgi:hypothetical protein
MNQIEKILLDIIFVYPINDNFYLKLWDRKYSLELSMIFIRKFIKKSNEQINSINQLFDHMRKFKSKWDHYLNIHYIVINFLNDLSRRYKNYSTTGLFSTYKYYDQALKLMDDKLCCVIQKWLKAIDDTYSVCGTSPHAVISEIELLLTNNSKTEPIETCFKALERYVKFFFCFFKQIDDSDSYNLCICLHKYINDEQFENIKLYITEKQFDSLIEGYNNILTKRSNKIKTIKVVYEKYYSTDTLKNTRLIFHYFYKDNETESFSRYDGCYVMDKDCVKKYVLSINWIVLDDNCEITIEEKKTLIKFIRIVISNNKCCIFDDIYDELLYELDICKDSFIEKIYCDAIKQLIKNQIIDKKYQMVLINRT